MTFCPNCGAQVEGRFCAKCGTAVAQPAASTAPPPGGYADPAAGYSQPQGGAYGQPQGAYGQPQGAYAPPAQAGGLADNIASLLCYSPVGIIADIIFLVAAPYNQNPLIRFHAFQSLFLAAAIFVLMIGLQIVGVILSFILKFLALILFPIFLLIWLGMICLFLFMMYKCYNNEKVVLPVVGPLAEKQAYGR